MRYYCFNNSEKKRFFFVSRGFLVVNFENSLSAVIQPSFVQINHEKNNLSEDLLQTGTSKIVVYFLISQNLTSDSNHAE